MLVVWLERAEFGGRRLTVVELLEGHDFGGRAQGTVVAQRGLFLPEGGCGSGCGSGCGCGRGWWWDRAATAHPAHEQDNDAEREGAVRGGRGGQRCGGTEAKHCGGREGEGRDVCGMCVYVGREMGMESGEQKQL